MVGAALRPLAAVLPVVPVVSFPVWLHHEAVSGWRGRCWGRGFDKWFTESLGDGGT